MAYIFDTNTLLEAKNRYYAFDVCPAFWDWLLLERQRGNVLSIEAVKGELEDPDAEAWGNANPAFFDANNDSRVGDVSNWVVAQPRFKQTAINKFLAKADPRVISYALVHGHVVVTQEVSAPLSQNEVKIPDVCMALGAQFKNSFQVLNELNARFILEVQP
jgi:hypothetical protein